MAEEVKNKIHKLDSLKNELKNQEKLVEKGPVVPKYVFKIAKQCFLDIKNEKKAYDKKIRFGFASTAKDIYDNDFDNECKESIENFFKISKSFIEFQRKNYKRKNDIKEVKELINKTKNEMNDLLNSGAITSKKVINIEELDSSNEETTVLNEVKQSYKKAEKSLSNFKKKYVKTSLTIKSTSMKKFENQISTSYNDIFEKKLGTIKGILEYYAGCQGIEPIKDLEKSFDNNDKYKDVKINKLYIINQFTEITKSKTDNNSDYKTYKELFKGVFNTSKTKLKKTIASTNRIINDTFQRPTGTEYASLEKINQDIDKKLREFNITIMAISNTLICNKEFRKKLSKFCSYSPKNTNEKEEKIKELYNKVKQNSFYLALYNKSQIEDTKLKKQIAKIQILGNIRKYIKGCIETIMEYINVFQNSSSGHSELLKCIDKLNKININAIKTDMARLSNESDIGLGTKSDMFDKLSLEKVEKEYKKIKATLDEIYSEYCNLERGLDRFKNYNSLKSKIFRTFKKTAQSTVAFINISSNLGKIFAGDYSAAGTLLNNANNLYNILKE